MVMVSSVMAENKFMPFNQQDFLQCGLETVDNLRQLFSSRLIFSFALGLQMQIYAHGMV